MVTVAWFTNPSVLIVIIFIADLTFFKYPEVFETKFCLSDVLINGLISNLNTEIPEGFFKTGL